MKNIILQAKKFLWTYYSVKTFLFSGIFALLLTSCQKESSVVGLEVQPQADLLNLRMTDTVSLFTLTQKIDSFATNKLNPVFFGSCYDPVLGQTTADFYTQVRVPGSQVKINQGDTLTPSYDSLILILPYSDKYYGSLNEAQTVEVYELADELKSNVTYYTTSTVGLKSTLLATKTFVPKPKDDVAVDQTTLPPHLRIRLDNAFGKKIMDSTNTYNDNSIFTTKLLKGLFIKSTTSGLTSGQGATIGFNILSPIAGMKLYYTYSKKRKTLDGMKDSVATEHTNITYETRSGIHFTHFQRDYSTSDINLQKQINQSPDSLMAGQQSIYLGGYSGLRLKISFPYINNLTDSGKIALNKAEIIMKIISPTNNGDYLPPKVVRVGIYDTTKKTIEILKNPLNEQEFDAGAEYDASKGEYRILITNYVHQAIANKIKSPHIYLFVNDVKTPGNVLSFDPARAVLGGGANTDNRMKLIVTYTKLP